MDSDTPVTTCATRELLRSSFRPDIIRVLFVGESPPAGGTFFYKADSKLAYHTKKAFTAVFGESVGIGEGFLDFFKNLGCYLDDLCLTPINHEEKTKRRRQHAQAVDGLAFRLRAASPQALVVVKKDIEQFVKEARDKARLRLVTIESLPFPAMGHQMKYESELERVLRSLQGANVLPSI